MEPGQAAAAGPTRSRRGRHSGQDELGETAGRSRAVRLGVLPAAVMAVLAAVVVVFVLRSQSGTAGAGTWTVLAVAAVLGCGVLAAAVYAGRAEDRRTARQYEALRRSVTAGQADLHAVVQRLERGEPVEQTPFSGAVPPRTDPLALLAYEIAVGMWQVRAALAQTAQLPRGNAQDSGERVEVFVNLARRLQSLVHRAINMLDQLENEVEDPELLKGLFTVDHLTTRIRRHAENVAVLGGSVSRRQWTRPVTLTEVLRSSIAEVEHYSRVKLVPPIEGTLRGHAVADVIHLLAELVENATAFSEPHTQVLLRAQRVASGLAVEVEDRGLGMPPQEQARINALLAEPDHVDLSKLLADGRIGLYVVSALARRHGIAVRLQSNIYGGIQAVLILPPGLLGDENAAAPPRTQAEMPRSAAPAQPSPAAGPAQATRPMTQPPLRQPLPPAQAAPPPHTRPPMQGGMPGDRRPALPQRHAQEHLAPELRDSPAPRNAEEQDKEHDPGLMALFQRGIRLADNEPDEPPTGSSR
ncbi:sensor histidine kinase [Streptomyces sp. NPDC057257]|uniref:sensor histidine kinase n=1 Tax=Streptomyces sp. NPDC057257 TaxID=3346071 RepID=UPI003638558C